MPLLVLVVGLVVIFLVLFLPLQFPNGTTGVTSFNQAKELSDQYIGTPPSDLRVAEIMEFQNNFYVRIQEKTTGINAYELLVDRYTGRVTPEPGPNMMWNTKYGMMGSYKGPPTTDMPINAQRAAEFAQQWLDSNIRGAQIEEPQVFYGYYTIDVSLIGSTYGMLSVDGYTGDVWYHTWHGSFIAEQEYS